MSIFLKENDSVIFFCWKKSFCLFTSQFCFDYRTKMFIFLLFDGYFSDHSLNTEFLFEQFI